LLQAKTAKWSRFYTACVVSAICPSICLSVAQVNILNHTKTVEVRIIKFLSHSSSIPLVLAG